MFRRSLEESLVRALGDRPVVLVHGARQVGKSTLVQRVASEAHPARYLTFDDATILAAARNDPAGFLAGQEGPVVLDEVQRVPELFLALKASVDRDRTAGRYLLTGSSNVLLVPRLSDSLAGRMEILTLWPLSQGEIEGRREHFVDTLFAEGNPAGPAGSPRAPGIEARVARGGYPEVLDFPEDRRKAWFGSYLTTILQRDVRDLAQIEGLTILPRLLSLIAARSATLVNAAELSRTTTIPQSTLKRYLTLLETTHLLHLLPPWSTNLGKRVVKTPKLFLNDSGLAAYLVGADRERLQRERDVLGPLLEGFVFQEVSKQAGWSETRPRLFHFRTHGGAEVDLVLEDSRGRVVGIEVKAGATVGAGDFRGLDVLAETAGRKFHRGVVLYAGSESVPFGARRHALPFRSLWETREARARRRS